MLQLKQEYIYHYVFDILELFFLQAHGPLFDIWQEVGSGPVWQTDNSAFTWAWAFGEWFWYIGTCKNIYGANKYWFSTNKGSKVSYLVLKNLC